MSRIAWARALALLNGLYLDQPDTWPQRLAPEHLARLQRPPQGEDGADTRAMREAIKRACAAGELAHAVEAFTFAPAAAWANIDDTPGAAAARSQAQTATCHWPAILAADFVRWLARQGEIPSRHVAAWGDATALLEMEADRSAELVGWYDATLHADQWFALPTVQPLPAALLLCCLDPDKTGENEASRWTGEHIGAKDFIALVRRFRAEADVRPGHRTLEQWLALARSERLKVDPWADEYLAASEVTAGGIGSVAGPAIPARVPLMQANRERVLAALRAADFDPLALPPMVRGKLCPAKAAARSGAKLTDASFDRAWKELSADGALRRT